MNVNRVDSVLTTPACKSTVAMRLLAPGTSSLLWTNFSTANTIPSLHLNPIAVPLLSTAFCAYSTCAPNYKLSAEHSRLRRSGGRRSGRWGVTNLEDAPIGRVGRR